MNETLRELDIGNIELDTVGLISLATSLAVNKQITYINLESPQILDNQVNHFMIARHLPSILTDRLSSTHWQDVEAK